MRWLKRFFPSNQPRLLPSLDAYALWSAAYPADAHNPLMETEQAAMLAMLPDLQGKIVLDLACGSGRYSVIAASREAKLVLSLDNSLPMLRAGTMRHAAAASLAAIPLPDASVDVVLCALALGHLPQLEPAVREISRVLKPGGVALVSDFHPFQYLRGARRTFSVGSEVFEVEHYVHLYADYHAVAGAAGLHIDAISEPTIANRGPVVLALRFYKA